jgi:hypothetical protein
MFRELFYSFIALLLLLGVAIATPVLGSSFPTGNEGGRIQMTQQGGNYFSPQQSNDQAVVVGNSVALSSTKGNIIATPHTLSDSGWVKVDFMSTSISGPVEISFGFNGVDQVQMVKGESWESYAHDKTRMVEGIVENIFAPAKILSTKVDSENFVTLGDSKLNPYKVTVTHESADPMTMKSTEKTDTIAYSSIDEKGNYIYKIEGQVAEKYTETYTDWKDLVSTPRAELKSLLGANKWDTIQNSQSILKNTWYSARFWVEIPFAGTEGISGKYNIAVKSVGADLSTAMILDPWYDAAWSSRKRLLCYGSPDSTVTNYQKKITVHDGAGTDIPERLAEYTTGLDSHYDVFGATWRGQNFTAESSANVTKVRLKLRRNGSLTSSYAVAIRATAAGFPTGANLCSANITSTYVSNVSGWYEFDMGVGTALTSGTNYAVIMYGSSANATNYLEWKLDQNGAYVEQNIATSANSGASWTSDAGYDFMFQIITTPIVHATVNNDFSDLRFTKSDGSTLLDYWVESYTSGVTADVWVELDTIAQMTTVNQNSTYYMYYGNAEAASASNGTNTFVKFEDFEWGVDGTFLSTSGGSVTWTNKNGTTSQIDTGLAYGGTRSAQFPAGNGTTIAAVLSASTAVRFNYYKPDTSVFDFALGNGGSTALRTQMNATEKVLIYAPSSYYAIGTGKAGSWGWIEERSYDNISETVTIEFDTTLVSAQTCNYTSAAYNYFLVSSVAGLVNIDNLIIRNYVSPEPLWGSPATAEALNLTVTTGIASVFSPTIETISNSNITSSITTNMTKWGIQYGLATATYTLWSNNTGNQETNFTWTQNVTGLTQDTTYYYRSFGSDASSSMFYGSERSFITMPNVYVTLNVSSITATSFNMNGNATLSTTGNNSMSYVGMYYGTATNVYSTVVNTTVTGSIPYAWTNTTSGMTQGNAYYAKAFAAVLGSVASNSTQSAFMTLPYPPTALTATITSPTSITLTYTHSAVGAGAVSYAYCRYAETDYPATTADGIFGFNTTLSSVAIGGLSPGHAYYFRVWATSAESGMMSSYSATSADVAAIPSYAGGFTGPSMYESTCGTSSVGKPVYAAVWAAQTFNVTSDAHTVSRVRVKLLQTGISNGVTVSIKRTSGGVPYGPDIGSGSLSYSVIATGAWAWYWFDMTPAIGDDISLEKGIQYAVVVSAMAGGPTENNSVSVFNTTTAYAGGSMYTSADGSYTWTASTENFCFDIWGYPCLEMISAKVYQNYLGSGDWLIACHYRDVYPPYFPGQDPTQYFVLQLMNGATVVAQTNVRQWGYRPGSIYMSAVTVTPLTWSSAYRVRIAGTYANAPYAEQVLSAGDWIGPDLTRLDSYLLSMATLMENYYSSQFITYVNGLSIFNSQGGTMFATGIPYLSSVRPGLFSTTVGPPPAPLPVTGNQSLARTYNYTTVLGPYVSEKLVEAGGFLGGVSGQSIGAIFVVLVYILVAGFAFMAGQSGAAIFLAFPIFLGGGLLGLIPLPVMFVALAVASFLLIYHVWLGRA